MKVLNYMNLNQHPVHLQFYRDRTNEFAEIYHAHQGMELLVVHEGSGSIVVEQQIFELKRGKLFFFRPYQLHRVQIDKEADKPYIRSFFVFEPELLEQALNPFPALQQFFLKLYKKPYIEQQLAGVDSAQLHTLLQAYQAMIEQAQPEELLEEQLLFLTNFFHLIKSISGQKWGAAALEHAGTGKTPSVAEQVMAWIEGHYEQPFELDKLAQAIHLSPNHLSYLFKQKVGSSITEYLTARRIRQACWLLKSSDMTIQEIGHAVGLGNFSYFCQLFKRHVGITPLQFRKSLPTRR
ncbi:AraC family transcriptional regulator [Paenibacillus montaniterrae]|uniref:AraC family transcriptional regulator n=1 Tax=Paenibacillus montaniterrae TaxID=429341 RepID=A0A919YKH6_9BACL|nr:AraC family transcriptional regulator [Paenibacillus montaniterrae]GIP16082.1 AraC family transcriptional regulator [Paenibacillus montaniterrae]